MTLCAIQDRERSRLAAISELLSTDMLPWLLRVAVHIRCSSKSELLRQRCHNECATNHTRRRQGLRAPDTKDILRLWQPATKARCVTSLLLGWKPRPVYLGVHGSSFDTSARVVAVPVLHNRRRALTWNETYLTSHLGNVTILRQPYGGMAQAQRRKSRWNSSWEQSTVYSLLQVSDLGWLPLWFAIFIRLAPMMKHSAIEQLVRDRNVQHWPSHEHSEQLPQYTLTTNTFYPPDALPWLEQFKEQLHIQHHDSFFSRP